MTKAKDIQLTTIQQKIFDACEPLLKSALDFHKKWARKIVEECRAKITERWKEAGVVLAGDITHDSYSVYKFVEHKNIGYDAELRSLLRCSIHTNACYMAGVFTPRTDPAKVWIDEEAYTWKMKQYEEEYRLWLTYKLKRSIEKYITPEFFDIKDINLRSGEKGYEIFATLMDSNDKKYTYHTRAISAGGYNIQEYHYRYITHIKEKA